MIRRKITIGGKIVFVLSDVRFRFTLVDQRLGTNEDVVTLAISSGQIYGLAR